MKRFKKQGRRLPRRDRLRHFVGDGVWASICEGIAENNFMAFGTAISASAGHLSLLTSYQSLMGCFLQLWSEKLIQIFGSRKRLVVTCVSFQSAVLASMALAALAGATVTTFFAMALAFTAFGGFSGAVWNSWVSELLPSRRRGFCFAVRNRRTYPSSFAAMLIAGLILQRLSSAFPGVSGMRWGFFTVFSIGFVAKVLSARHLSLQPGVEEPLFRTEQSRLPGAKGPLTLIVRCTNHQATRRVLTFFGILGFSVGVSTAFTTPYQLKHLGFSYLEFTLSSAALVAARFAVAPFVGAKLDQKGSRAMLLGSAVAMPVIGIAWAVSHSFVAIVISQIVGGVIWTAFDLSWFAYLVESTPSEERTTVFSGRQMVWSLATFAGAAVGAAIGSHSSLGVATFTVFLISAAGRAVAPIFLFAVPARTVLLAGSEQLDAVAVSAAEATSLIPATQSQNRL